jgi:hypothetical protein
VRSTGSTVIEVTGDANRRSLETMLSRRDRQVFFGGSCATANSYYFNANGDAPVRAAMTIEAAWHSAPLRSRRLPIHPVRRRGRLRFRIRSERNTRRV